MLAGIWDLVSVKMIASLAGGGGRKAFGPVSLILLWLLKSKGTYKNQHYCSRRVGKVYPAVWSTFHAQRIIDFIGYGWVMSSKRSGLDTTYNLNEYNGLINYFT